jgi:hypothetical protein
MKKSVTQTKSFIASTPGANVIKLAFFANGTAHFEEC